MAPIPAGTFTMGRDNASDPEETPAHPVSVAAFAMDRRPVTNERYAEFVKSTSHAAPSGWVNGAAPDGQEDWPVTGVSWDDANAYCTSNGWRLPTEAEWEYAARGTDGRLYPWGNNFSPALTNSSEAALGHPEEVGAHGDAISPFGLFDMSGNVWEWTADDYKPYPGHAPTFSIPADAKAIRGGSYKSDKLHVTTTTRNLDHASSRSATIGFRCAK
jgi:serine/threonine-protein kinase